MNFLKLIKKNMIIAVAMLISATAVAQEEPTFTISGSIDTYFRTNLSGGTNDPTDGGTTAPATSFANGTGFSLGMANVIMSYDGAKVGFVADLVVGPRGAEAVLDQPMPSPSRTLFQTGVVCRDADGSEK